jgi:hypothetical protein
MREYDPGDRQSPDNAAKPAYQPYRTDWRNIDEQRRARDRHESAGASRDLPTAELVGGGA